MAATPVRLALAGDVMTGRGIDQILPRPLPPRIQEVVVHDARDYVALAEGRHGPIPRPVGYAWPWGDALDALDAWAPHVRIMNLETSVTHSDDFAPGKAVHYRMSPENVGCLEVARTDVWTLANNHVLDYGPAGLQETLAALSDVGLRTAGAGRDAAEAWQPADARTTDGRILVWAVGHGSSGTAAGWAATAARPGVAYLADFSESTAAALGARIRDHRRAGDLVVVSIHWGANWGFQVPGEQVRFAHLLVDAGVDLIHGHSSHHARPAEVYRGRLVLYGCGDLVNDYEGIGGHREYRGDLRLVYLATLHPDGRLLDLRMLPLQARRMRLEVAEPDSARWLAETLDRHSRALGTRVAVAGDGLLWVQP